ncbi:PAAR domain-containing protein [Pseudomonas syringae pv. coriandricola]|uniref:PAAR domain-containing protein n=2 Tax=Pseudomonas syringae group genomosp. 3 TaxID=251701 RepID=A0A3M4TRD9_9PSED|nr:PAAR domain-containing protein [Pseudomonas syringae]RMM80616.1 PAAR domain-containing protein [Pseudomonas syringae pv. maculicola]RMR29804.1 PAAR domain-containing protein [Pseudomonas syringae pv. coriandricola]RMU11690.1 PAAR domain-containing protein [Pseudomonas syringae pv. coriandricola]RMV26448.1 PAAR domain-containing protein [Pseudomonas syringae pv. maculicola]
MSSARLGDQHACPLPGHGLTLVATASGDVLINALCAARVGDICACGAVIVAGFPWSRHRADFFGLYQAGV